MLVKISDIKIRKRIRVDIGDIELLKESLNKFGLFHPVTINDKYELISGFRRLQSAKELGWETIEAKIIDEPGKIELIERELEENLVRKDFTDSELQEAYKRLRNLRQPGFFRRIVNFFINLIKRKKAD